MKRAVTFLIAAVALVAANELRAERVTLAAGEIRLHDAKESAPEYSAFAGDGFYFDIPVDAPIGSKVRFDPQFFQISSGLAAPQELHLDFKTPVLEFKDRTRLVAVLGWNVANVKNPTWYLARFTVSSADTGSKVVGNTVSMRVLVYPKEQASEWAKALVQKQKESGLTVRVFGEGKSIREYLRTSGVEFSDEGEAWPQEMKGDSLYLAQVSEKKIVENARLPRRARLILFATGEKSRVLPGVYRVESGAGSVTKVTLPILSTVENDPRSQNALFDLLAQNLNRSMENL